MEDKKLDFSQPLMSVRRFSPAGADEKKRTVESSEPKIPPLPVYKSELKSGPVRNPGTVPFQWEKIPGKPKDEDKPPSLRFRKPQASPKPPPGRNSNAKNGEEEDKDRKRERERKESLDSGESNEAYLDAQDTLSRTESFFINCSFSGLSEFDSADSRQFETFSTDLQNRDFMIRRFLPAAKAMASETPQHSIKKQTPQKNPPWELQKVALPLNSYEQMASTHYEHDIVSDDDNSLYEYSSSTKICGLLPRFCLLNPIPVMKTPVRSLQNANEKKMVSNFRNEKLEPKGRTDRRSSKHGFWNSDEPMKQNAILAGAAEKDIAAIDSQRRCFREFLETDPDSSSDVVEKTLYIDSVHKLKSPKSNSEVQTSDLSEAHNLNVWASNNDSKSLKTTNGTTIESNTQNDSRSESRRSKENSDKAMDLRNQLLKSPNGGRPQFPLAPPLPKSPSESWLKRTLQTVPRSSTSSRLQSTSHDPRWDGHVKTAQNGHGNTQFSEVLLATIPEV